MYDICNSDTYCCVNQLLHFIFQGTNVPLLQHTDMCQLVLHSAYRLLNSKHKRDCLSHQCKLISILGARIPVKLGHVARVIIEYSRWSGAERSAQL